MEYILEMKGISKSFYGVEVLHDVDFNVKKGECIALCGENGAGKSTLMKILARVNVEFSGTMVYKGEYIDKLNTLEVQQRGISMIHQELNLMDHLTVAENIYLCREPTRSGFLNHRKMFDDAEALLADLEPIDPRAKIRDLGIAKKQIVEIAKALSVNADLLIMDEPTAVLTSDETDMLFRLIEKLKKNGVSIIYISHRLKEIKQICDRITVLRDGNYIATKNIDEVTENDIAELMVGRKVSLTRQNAYDGSGEVALEVRNVSDSLLSDVSLSVRKGEILGISGLVGAGRTELAEVIFGIRKPRKGQVFVYGQELTRRSPIMCIKNKVGFATEDRKGTGLFLDRSITENTTIVQKLLGKGFVNRDVKDVEVAEGLVRMFNTKCTNVDQHVKNLSGGNQQKVVLSKWVAVNSHVLILDEPTRGVDIGARAEIYEIISQLAKQNNAVIVISSDLTEVIAVSQRVVVMHQGSISGELTGEDITEENIMVLATGIGSK
ncbi:MAG: sugar ABC transporter ATP-binding protein [Spartobacteria bacterium]|nr:sugar ABC transporter ATP-binding protein [Spartobacteria bacterium]